MRFRKKPVEIDAILIDELFRDDISEWPEWVRASFDVGAIYFNDRTIWISTPEGSMLGQRTDWLIRGIRGELYPCKPDIFEASYEAVESPNVTGS